MKKILAWTMALAMLSGAACSMNLLSLSRYKKDPSLPRLEGTLSVPGLKGKVDVYRDEHGVPHIFSEDEHDLFFAIGYVQAQDRLWEMTLFRAIAEGRMSELFGDVGVPGVHAMGFEARTVSIDKYQRTMGYKYMGEIADKMLAETNPEIYSQLQAYCDGVNAFVDSRPRMKDLPLEFQMLRVRPGRWEVKNFLAFGRFIGNLLSSNMPSELARHAAVSELGEDAAWDLIPLWDHQGPTIVPPELLKNKLDLPRDLPPGGRPSAEELGFAPELTSRAALSLLEAVQGMNRAMGADDSFGSNNWIVMGSMTESGNAILSNDPHLSHIEPSLFYLMRIKGCGYDAYGVTFPGCPYVVLGHARKLAWGATTSRADVMDLFVESVDKDHPGAYKYKGEWREFTTRTETIMVNIGFGTMAPRRFEVKHSMHGPIINDIASPLPKGSPPIALRWSGWDVSRDVRAFEMAVTSSSADEFIERYREMDGKFDFLSIVLGLEQLNRGESIQDFISAMDMIDVPDQNWVAADSDGHIVYLPGGLVPIRGKGIGVLPVPGETGEFDWTGFIPTMELPHAIDPARGWMVTANNEVVDAEWYPYTFSSHYGEPWRAMRIEKLIRDKAPLSVQDMIDIQNDVYVVRAEWEVPMILKAVERKKPTDPRVLRAAERLEEWDYQADLDSTGTLVFYQFYKELHDNVLEDEGSKELVAALKLEGYPDMAVNLWLEKGESPYFDDKRTPDVVEDMDDMIVKSLADAMEWIEKKYGEDPSGYEWGKVHVIKWFHPLALFGGFKDMSVGPFPYEGANQTVRNAKEIGFGKVPYKAFTGACLRTVVDLGDVDEAQIMIDGSQSGQYLSPHYDDMHELFVNGQYIQADKNVERVKENARYHLEMLP